MKGLFGTDRFTGFGPSRFRPAGSKPRLLRARGLTEKLHEAVRGEAPKVPGVYGMLDRHGVLVYVGKAKSLRCRLMSYFRPKSRDPKAGRIIEETRALLWEPATSEFAALLRELELIRRFLPRFNSQGKPGRARYHYLCVGRAPAPYAYLARKPTGKEVACFGPLTGRAMAQEAVRRLNDFFGLRDCARSQKMHFADQPELFPVERSPGCLRYEIGSCCGPCVGACSRRDYQERTERLLAFLEGRDAKPLTELEVEMERASAGLLFERAAALRDRLTPLAWLSDRLGWLRRAREEHSFVYPLAGDDGATLWYVIHRGQVRAVTGEPRTPRDRERVRKVLSEAFRETSPAGGLVPAGLVDSVLLVAAWFRKHPEQRERLMTRQEAEGLVG